MSCCWPQPSPLERLDTTLRIGFIFLYFLKKAPKFYGFQEASEKRKCHFCTLFVKQDLDAHAGRPQLLCPQHAGPRGPRGPHRRAAGSTRTCGARMGFKALVSTARPAAQSDTRSPRATRWPPREFQAGGSTSRCADPPRAAPTGPGFGAAFQLGAALIPPSPLVWGGPGRAHPWQQRPAAPPRENGLWIEGDKLHFMTLTGERRAGRRRPRYLLSRRAGAQGRAAAVVFSLPCFK